MLFRPDFECEDGNDLKNSLSKLFEHADQMIDEGANVLILSDRGLSEEFAAIPALLASSGLHHHLINQFCCWVHELSEGVGYSYTSFWES